MVHLLFSYVKQVDKTHKGLGRLFSFCLMIQKARKMGIIIAVSGIGKSTAIEAAAKCNKDGSIEWDSMTRSGLKMIEKDLSGFEGCFIVRDLGNIDTQYSLKESIKTAVMLVHEHGLSKLNSALNIRIDEYYGSFMTSAQPIIMQDIVNSQDWEAVIRDKTIRYYHLIRPIKVNNDPIDVKADWGIPLKEVSRKIPSGKKMRELYEVGFSQWGIARAKQHIDDMVRACAALDNRTEVKAKDITVCLELTKPMRIEKHLIAKEGFESDKEFLHNHACLLTEFATYKDVSYDQLMRNYQVNERTLNRILYNVKVLFLPDLKRKRVLKESKQAFDILHEGGYL